MINRVSRLRNTVRRPTAFWSQAVPGLLRHLESACFPAPRVLHAGNGEYGTETLTWIEGTPPAPTAGRTLSPRPAYGRGHGSCAAPRHSHRLPPARDQRAVLRPADLAPGEIIWHGDFGP